MKYLLFIIFLFIFFLSDYQQDVRADNGCSHSIRIRIMSRNEFFVEEKQRFFSLKDIKKMKMPNYITLKWHLSSRSKKISVTTDKVGKRYSIGLIKKEQDSDMQFIKMTSKSKDIIKLKANYPGKCRINYNLPTEMADTKNKKMNMTFTLTDDF